MLTCITIIFTAHRTFPVISTYLSTFKDDIDPKRKLKYMIYSKIVKAIWVG